MKHFVDGNQLVITRDDFVDLEESPALFFPLTTHVAETVLKGGLLSLPLEVLRDIFTSLQRQANHESRRHDL